MLCWNLLALQDLGLRVSQVGKFGELPCSLVPPGKHKDEDWRQARSGWAAASAGICVSQVWGWAGLDWVSSQHTLT